MGTSGAQKKGKSLPVSRAGEIPEIPLFQIFLLSLVTDCVSREF